MKDSLTVGIGRYKADGTPRTDEEMEEATKEVLAEEARRSIMNSRLKLIWDGVQSGGEPRDSARVTLHIQQ